VKRNQTYIQKIRKVTLRKLDEITASLVINTDTLLEEKLAENLKKVSEGP
jgi:hypothetical protein